MSLPKPPEMQLDLDSNLFLRELSCELTGRLEKVVGLDDAEGYTSSVCAAIDEWTGDQYRAEMGDVDLDPAAVAEIFVDLEKTIARGDVRCRIAVRHVANSGADAKEREYDRTTDVRDAAE